MAGARGLVLAVSGGPDSTALMHLAAAWRPNGVPLHVATVDHGLRPEARREAEAVVAAAARLDLPATLLHWEGNKPERRLQERARAARYGLLLDLASTVGASHLVTAHTLDDQAETLLMRLAAGSGPRGLAGMRVLSTRGNCQLARPFLALRKATLVTLCRENGWPFVEDPGNGQSRFARARWRSLAPALAAEGLTPERLGHLAARLARADDALQIAATRAARDAAREAPPGSRAFGAVLFDEPDEIMLRVLDEALAAMAPQAPSRLHKLEALLSALRAARRDGIAARHTLRGSLVTLSAGGALSLRAAPPRRPVRDRKMAARQP